MISTRKSIRRGGILLLAAVSLMLTGAQVADEDGTRMRAPQIEIPSTHQDSLSPPDDSADWRYLALEEPSDVEAKLTVEPKQATVTLTVRRSSGDVLVEKETDGGSVVFKQSLEPGIIYVGVSSEEECDYTLEFK